MAALVTDKIARKSIGRAVRTSAAFTYEGKERIGKCGLSVVT